MSMAKTPISIRLSEEQIKWLAAAAQKADCSRSEVLTKILDHFRANTEEDGSLMPRIWLTKRRQ